LVRAKRIRQKIARSLLENITVADKGFFRTTC